MTWEGDIVAVRQVSSLEVRSVHRVSKPRVERERANDQPSIADLIHTVETSGDFDELQVSFLFLFPTIPYREIRVESGVEACKAILVRSQRGKQGSCQLRGGGLSLRRKGPTLEAASKQTPALPPRILLSDSPPTHTLIPEIRPAPSFSISIHSLKVYPAHSL
jgi:hypothetical protein